MSFLWTKAVNYMEESNKMKDCDWWNKIKSKTGSRDKFNTLFSQKEVED
jgi:hypothetical protein